MPKLYLIRHAEPTVTGVFHGCRNDVPLRDAPPTFDLPVEVVYVSPMQRARQTAANFTVPQIVLEELREIDFGQWGGLGWDEIEQRWPELTRGLNRNWFGVSPPGGESWADFTSRVARVLKVVLADPRPKAIVAHGAVNAVAAGLLRGGDPSQFKQHYAQVSEFEA
jgi:broad specificity phosphatase PhoE